MPVAKFNVRKVTLIGMIVEDYFSESKDFRTGVR